MRNFQEKVYKVGASGADWLCFSARAQIDIRPNGPTGRQGWRQEFSDGGLTLLKRGLRYGSQGTINTKNIRKNHCSPSDEGWQFSSVQFHFKNSQHTSFNIKWSEGVIAPSSPLLAPPLPAGLPLRGQKVLEPGTLR